MSGAAPSPATLRILLVEDSPDDAELIEMTLRRARIECSLSRIETEPELDSQFNEGVPDLILCDFHLPRFSCRRVLELVNARVPRVPVVVVSHHISAAESSDMKRLGASRCVLKSCLAELPEAVRATLDESRRR